MAHLLSFEGSCHPQGEPDDYDGTFLTVSDIQEKAKQLEGTPVWVDHDGKQQVGRLTGGRVDDRGRLIAQGVIDRNSWAGVEAARRLRGGELSGLSLGLSHTLLDDPDIMRIVSKDVTEISLTGDPELPDTDITNVGDDTEQWKLARTRIEQSLQKNNLKKAVDKNRAELRGLIQRRQTEGRGMSDVSEPLAAPAAAAEQQQQQQQQHGEEESVEHLQARLREAMERAAVPGQQNEQQQQQQQQPADAASTGEEGAETDEVAQLKAKVARQQKHLGELDAAKSDTDALIAAVKQDPDLYARILNAHQGKQQKLRSAMEDSEQEILDRLTADYIAAGKTPDAELLNAVKAGKDRPEAFRPLFKYLTTAASAAANKKITEVEKQYQAAKSENEDMKKLLQQSEKVMSRLGDERSRQHRVDKFTGSMKRAAPDSAASGSALAPIGAGAGARAAKAARVGEDSDVTTGGTTADFHARWREMHAPRARSSAAPKDIRPPAFTVPQAAIDSGLLDALMQGSADRTGIERVDYQGIVGRDWQQMLEGTSDDGFMLPNVDSLRSAGPPQ